MKLNRLLLHFVIIVCGSGFYFQAWAATPVPSGAKALPGNAPIKTTVQTIPLVKPDLVVVSAAFNHPPKQGETLGTQSILNVHVKNQGTQLSPQTTVMITCTPLGNKPCPVGLSGTLSSPPLAINQSATLPWPNSGGVWTVGSFKIGVEVDSAKSVAESNEGNNIKTFDVSILANSSSGPWGQSAGEQQFGGTSSTPPANITPGQAAAGLNKQTQKIRKGESLPPAANVGSNQNLILSSLSITSPADGAAFYIGKTYTLTWNDIKKTAQTVKIMLVSKTSNAVTNIAQNVPNTGTYEWKVNQGGGTTGNNGYALKIEGQGAGPNYSDSKDISTLKPEIHITNPQSGAVWNKSVPVSHTITWQKVNMPESAFGSQVRVRVGCRWAMPGGGGYSTNFFETVTPNDGEYVYTGLHEAADGNIRFGQNGSFVIVESLDEAVADKVKITINR